MATDEVVKKLKALDRNYLMTDDLKEALQSAISLIQDYQKLRGLIDKAQVKLEQARILSVKEPMQLSDRINLNGIIREAQSYLQQPTEH